MVYRFVVLQTINKAPLSSQILWNIFAENPWTEALYIRTASKDLPISFSKKLLIAESFLSISFDYRSLKIVAVP